MRVLEWNKFLDEGLPDGANNAAMTVGVFDGIHRGHKSLIERVIHHDECFVPVIITFRHNLKNQFREITSIRQKIEIFESIGAAITVVADLSESFRSMNGTEFLRLLRERCKMGFLAVGKNFRCGFRQDTDAEKIMEINAGFSIPTEILEVLSDEGLPISSSRIRMAISEGKLKSAETMLGRPFILDLRDIAAEKSGAQTIYDMSLSGRALPPGGRYSAKLLGGKNNNGIKTDIEIENGIIRIPAAAEFDFTEFGLIEFS